MSEYVFRDASGYGCDMSALMDGGRVTVGDYFASENNDHYGTLHEEIVRCRDCRFCMAYMACTYCDYMAHVIDYDGFCAWGVRKEVG